MADSATNREQMADNASEISSFSDSSDEAKKEVEIVEEAIEETDKPIYTEEDLETLIGFIRNMIFLFDYDEDDFNEEVVEVIKLWLTDANCPLLFVFYDGDILTASLGFPLCPFNDLMYFMREPDQLFNVIRFHDDIMFGTLQSDIEGSLLVILEQVYGPLILSAELSENVKANVLSGYNTFMTYLTELHYKLSGFTLLYVPREGNDMDVQEVVLNRSMIKRLESVVIDWTSQIRSTLSDTQHFVPDNLICPADEYSFWIYRHEVLSAIKTQFANPNIEHILQILNLAQSLYTKPLREVLADLSREIEIAESNIPFLKLLVDPCFAIRTLNDEDDLCSQLIYVMHIIRFIGVDSSHLRRHECITKLFLYLSNEIVSCCVQSIDINKILMGSPCYGIEICNLKINCCESYKIIYEEMLEHFQKEYSWNLDYATIFNQINAFIQRLCDILEICEAMMIFGRYSGSNSYKSFRFPCNNAQEYEQKCDQVMTIFTKGIENIQSSASAILDINNKDWYKTIAEFRNMLRNLDDVIENLLSNIFLVAENLEEKIDVLVALLNFYNRDSIKESYMRKIAEIWKIFHAELTTISKEVSSGINIHPTLLPIKSGQYTMLKIKFERLCRLKNLLERCRFFPTYNESEETLSLFESCEKQVKLSLKKFNDSWTKSLSPDFGAWFHRNLICRSQIRPGLLECHIEREMLNIFNEAHFFKVLGVATPSIMDLDKNDTTRQTFDSVIRVVLYFNSVVSSISEKERLFFKPMIQQTERKLEPLRSKLTWDEDLNEYIDTFVTNVKELLDIIQIYKRENYKISRSMETIYNLELFKLNKSQNQQLNDLFKNISDQKKESLSQLVGVYTDISKNIFFIYDHLGSNLRRMGESWIQYVRKIDRLLKAAVYNSSLITLKNMEKALIESHHPILSIEIVLDRTGVVYQPTLAHVEVMLKRLTAEVTTTIKIIPTLCQKFQIDAGENIYDAFLTDEQYLNEERKIKTAINNTIGNLVAFKEKWNVFRPFWSVNRVSFIEKFQLASMTSEAFQKNIEKFDELLNQLTTQSELTICECVHVDAQKLKYAITNHIHDWQLKYIEYLKCVSYGLIIDFNNKLNQNMQAMSIVPKEVEDLKELEATFNRCFNDIPRMLKSIDSIVGYFDVLEKYVSDVLPEALHLRKNIREIWNKYMEYVNKIKEEIADYQTQFKLSMTNEAACLKVNALEMLKMLDTEMPINDDILPEDAFAMIEELVEKLETLKAQEKIIADKMRLLGVEYHPLDIIKEISRKLESMKIIWEFADVWQKTKQDILSRSYEMVSAESIHEEVMQIRCNLQNLVNCILPDMHYPIYIKTTTEVVDFCKTMEIVIDMKRSYLRDRHWLIIQDITKTPFENHLNLLLQDMMEYKFFIYENDFKTLCSAARKEFEIETQLKIVERSAAQLKFITKQSTLGAHIIMNSDDVFSTAKQNLVTIDNLILSVYRKPFQEKIYYWEEALNYIIDLLDVLLVIAQKTQTLTEIFNVTKFSSSMAAFNNAFIACNEQWNEMMHYIVTSNLRNDICPQGIDLLQKLDVIRNEFEHVFLMLNQTMNDKRNSCSRLNLVPDDLLIKMIAFPANLDLLLNALNYMFENVSNICTRRLDLSDKFGHLEVTGIQTNADEIITFVQAILIDSVATSENIVRMIEYSIQQALKKDLQKCLHQLKETFFKRIESGWIGNFGYQICLKSIQIDNTHLIKNAITQSVLLKKNKPMKMLRTLHNRLLNDLAKSYNSNPETTGTSSLKRKLNAMIITEINTRDVVDKLTASNVRDGLNNVEWLSCIRSYWSNESLSCIIAHVNNRFHYGFELKSCYEPLFITPCSNRLLITISSALKYRFIPYLTGNDEKFSLHIIKQLSVELAVLFIILSCDPNWRLDCILRCLDGMLQLQSWLCFSGIEHVSSNILTRINEKLTDASFIEKKNYVLDLKKNKIQTTFQIFVTSTKKNNRIELDRAIIRNVQATLPDQGIVFQNILWTIGFPRPRKMANQLVAFMLDIAMFLPDLNSLWTPTRIQHAIMNINEVTEQETILIASVLQNEFYPCLSENDKQIFNKCLENIFKNPIKQELAVSSADHNLKYLFDSQELMHSQLLESYVRNMINVLTSTYQPLIVLGDACSGKSKLLDLALRAISLDGEMIKKYVLNPETFQDDTISKKNGIDDIIATIFASTVHTRKCVIFDSVARSNWIEKVGSLQQYLNSDLEKICTEKDDVKIVVETTDLSTITPKSLANYSIVHVDGGNVTWRHIFLPWIERNKFLPPDFKTDLQELAGDHFETLLKFRTSSTFIQNTDVNIIKTFLSMYETIMTSWRKDESTFSALHWKNGFKMLFFFCCVWSIGANLDTTERGKFDVLLRESITDVLVSFPLKGNVYQYFVDVSENSSCWIFWNESHLDTKITGSFINTIDNIPYQFIIKCMILNEKPVLLASNDVVGKSAMLKHILHEMQVKAQATCVSSLNCNTSSNRLGEILRWNTMKISKEIVYPKDRKNMIWFLDDLNSILSNNTDTTEFLRHVIEHRAWIHKKHPQRLQQTNIVAAMRNSYPLNTFSASTKRLLNKFHTISFNPCSDESNAFIFSNKMLTTNQSITSNKFIDVLAPATIDLIRSLAIQLPATPVKPRCQFSLKTVDRILISICTLSPNISHYEKNPLLRLWIHECFRETWDLLDCVDYKLFYDIFNDIISKYFEATLHSICPGNKSPLFCDVLNQEDCYEDVKEINQLMQFAEKATNLISNSKTIVYQEAIEHASKLLRIIRMRKGHMVLVGETGSGRQTMCDLATHILNFHKTSKGSQTAMEQIENICIQLKFATNESEDAVDKQIGRLFELASKNRVICLVLADNTNNFNHYLLELLNSFIVNDSISGFLSSKIYNESKVLASVKNNLHFVLCLPLDIKIYRYLLSTYTSLLTNTSTNCIHPLTEVSLMEVAKQFFKTHIIFDVPILSKEKLKDNTEPEHRKRDSLIQSTEERFFNSSVDAVARIHTVLQHHETLENKPLTSWFFELLFTFQSVLMHKRNILRASHEKFNKGINKIMEATHNVTVLQDLLEKQQLQIETYQSELETFIENIETQTVEADEQKQEVAIQRVKIGAEEVICKQLADIAEADLAKAMPALNSAIAALDSLNKKDMNEIKSYARPPVKVELVLNAVMILLGKEPTWVESKRQLGEQKFLDTLRNFDKNNITDKTLKTIGGYARNPELEPNKVGIVSKAAKSLILWVRAIENYGKVYKYVGPKIKKMEDANASLLEKQMSLKSAEQKLVELAEKLADLRKEYEYKIKCKQELEEQARQMAIKLQRAKSLVSGLSNEKVRWTKIKEQLENEYHNLIGDTLHAAGTLVYFGSLSSMLRENIRMQWMVDLEALEIPFNKIFNLFEFFYKPDDLQKWQNNGLPVDPLSLENATILLQTKSRTPLIIDPQSEIQQWLVGIHSSSNLLMYDINDEIIDHTGSNASQSKNTIVFNNFHENSMPILIKSLHKLLEIEHDPNDIKNQKQCLAKAFDHFSIYLLSNENIPYSCLFKKDANMINFVLGLPGLETKLLTIVVQHENPSLEERKETLMQTIIDNNKTLFDLEENILRLLNESQMPLLENEELYSTLQISKQTTDRVNIALDQDEHTRQEIESSRENYRPCAGRSCLLFFVVDSLKNINPLYVFSLHWYFALFQNSLRKCPRSQVIEERNKKIIDFHTYNVFRNVCFGLKPQDRNIFGFMLCVRLLFAEERMSLNEYNFLLHGPRKIDRVEQIENPSPNWISSEQWDNITELDKMPGFLGIAQSFEESNDDWKNWYKSPCPELEKMPLNWERNLTKFQKNIVVRCLRLDRFEPCMTEYIDINLGKKYTYTNRSNLSDVLSESSAQMPILFLTDEHSNPSSEVQFLAKAEVTYLNMNSDSIQDLVHCLKSCVAEEKWLYISNPLNSKLFVIKFPTVLKYLKSVDSKCDFRLWVNMTEYEHVPLVFLQNCIKIAYHKPMGIQQNMSMLFEEIGEREFEKLSKNAYHTQIKKLLFSLSFLHSLLNGRSKFKTLGWLESYTYELSDFYLARKLLTYSIKDLTTRNAKQKNEISESISEIIPRQFIENVCFEICYKSQITNFWDQRIFDSYFNEIFYQQFINISRSTLISFDGRFSIPRDGNFQAYKNFILKQIPVTDGIKVFALNENANIQHLESQSSYLLQMLRKIPLDPQAVSSFQIKPHVGVDFENAKQTIQKLLTKLPVCLDYDNAVRIVGANRTPVSDALLLEIHSYNQIVGLVRRNLEQTFAVLLGECCLNEEYEGFLEHLRQNRVPHAWIQYPTNKCFSDWIHDLRYRVEFFRRWSETGQLSTNIILGYFIRPVMFLKSVLQLFARANNVSVTDVDWRVTVFTTIKPIVKFTIEDGFIAREMHLQNGGWDLEKQCLREPNILQMSTPMPPIHFKPVIKNEDVHDREFLCPCFYGINRSEESFVCALYLKTGDFHKEKWVNYNTAITLTN